VLWLTLLIALVIAALAVGYVVWPLVRPSRPVLVDEDGPLADLLLRKDTVLQSIKELEFDYQTGKLSTEDYERLNLRLRHQAIGLLRQIEGAMPNSAGLELELEEAIRRQRKVAEPSQVINAKPTLACPNCQAAVRASDNFCPKCGFSLAPATAH
jgi:hypothetical protein